MNSCLGCVSYNCEKKYEGCFVDGDNYPKDENGFLFDPSCLGYISQEKVIKSIGEEINYYIKKIEYNKKLIKKIKNKKPLGISVYELEKYL